MATLAPPEPLIEKYGGRVTPQEGLDQPCWIVDRSVLREALLTGFLSLLQRPAG